MKKGLLGKFISRMICWGLISVMVFSSNPVSVFAEEPVLNEETSKTDDGNEGVQTVEDNDEKPIEEAPEDSSNSDIPVNEADSEAADVQNDEAGSKATDVPEEEADAAKITEEEYLEKDTLLLQATSDEAKEKLAAIIAERQIFAVVYLAETIDIKSDMSYDSEAVITVGSGQTVEVLDYYFDAAMTEWIKVSTYYDEATYVGYIPRQYLAISDERFLSLEEEYNTTEIAKDENGTLLVTAMNNSADIDMFPSSYQGYLRQLKEAHPKWTFVKMETGLDFNDSIANEIGNKSLVYKTFPDYTKNGLYGTNWYYATEGILRYYMDPRNMLTEDRIFQFEQLTYNESYHTQAALEMFLNNTFMSCDKNAPGMNITYGLIIWALGKDQNVSPFHMAARIVQEQGTGTSPIISGTYPGYEGYYNFFNIKASGRTNEEIITSGLNHAKEQGWNSVYNSISGGAYFISANYISKGQDTIYLEKFNVNPDAAKSVYTHQYMQNISGPTTEALSMKKLYQNAGALDNTFVFKIPVYKNMPSEACLYPSNSTSISVHAPAGYSAKDAAEIWIDGVAYKTGKVDAAYSVDTGNTNAKTAVMYKYDEADNPIGMYVWTMYHNGANYEITAQPEMQDLITHSGYSVRISGKPGLRVKTNINQQKRKNLIENGANGYKLKEYGTIAMNNNNRSRLPFVKGGEKVNGTVSYGYDKTGKFNNYCIAIKEGQIQYTSVLVGLKPEQYKTEIAFRGYAVITKDGEDAILYGPITSRSNYGMAKSLIESGKAKDGTEAYKYLAKVISDADGE